MLARKEAGTPEDSLLPGVGGDDFYHFVLFLTLCAQEL